MKRLDLCEIMDMENMAIITDEENRDAYAAERIVMYRGEMQEKILNTIMKIKVKSSKEDQNVVSDKFITLLESLNSAFNRSVGAPDSMRLFKIIDKKSRYTGNETVSIEIELATLATGAGSAIYTLLDFQGLCFNIFKTEANIMSIDSKPSSKTYGLGNALKSWKSVMNKYGRDFTPAILINYVQ